jgi:hypothetical protein
MFISEDTEWSSVKLGTGEFALEVIRANLILVHFRPDSPYFS